ncbi:MAG: hypothetical protein U5N86_09790 [Planctomycetota bacterium]|nr:hypothetical protein [Planctomycetota bacterium]
MIQVSLATLVFIYILGLGGTILLFWLVIDKLIGKPDVSLSAERVLLRCDICAHEFVDSSDERYMKCPVCDTVLDRESNAISEDGAKT